MRTPAIQSFLQIVFYDVGYYPNELKVTLNKKTNKLETPLQELNRICKLDRPSKDKANIFIDRTVLLFVKLLVKSC
jgi:hypothetical protein